MRDVYSLTCQSTADSGPYTAVVVCGAKAVCWHKTPGWAVTARCQAHRNATPVVASR